MKAWRGWRELRAAARLLLLTGMLAGALAGCEGVVTGAEIARVPLQPAEGGAAGAYAPVKFTLSADMNPVAFNFRADFTMNSSEFGKWNTYQATLSKDGNAVVTRTFNVNHPASASDGSPPPPSSAIHTLFLVDVQGGEYELTITPAKPVAVTLTNAHADARRNVQRPPQ